MRFCSNFRNVSYVPGNELFQVTKKQLHAGSYANTDAVQLQEIMPNMISSVQTLDCIGDVTRCLLLLLVRSHRVRSLPPLANDKAAALP